MGARATQPATGRGARRTGWDFGPHMETDVAQGERDAAAGAQVARAAVLERIVHPVIERTGKPFRVVRLFLREGHTCYEDIGEALTVDVATLIMKREQWRAQVFSDLDMLQADNWRSMERR